MTCPAAPPFSSGRCRPTPKTSVGFINIEHSSHPRLGSGLATSSYLRIIVRLLLSDNYSYRMIGRSLEANTSKAFQRQRHRILFFCIFPVHFLYLWPNLLEPNMLPSQQGFVAGHLYSDENAPGGRVLNGG